MWVWQKESSSFALSLCLNLLVYTTCLTDVFSLIFPSFSDSSSCKKKAVCGNYMIQLCWGKSSQPSGMSFSFGSCLASEKRTLHLGLRFYPSPRKKPTLGESMSQNTNYLAEWSKEFPSYIKARGWNLLGTASRWTLSWNWSVPRYLRNPSEPSTKVPCWLPISNPSTMLLISRTVLVRPSNLCQIWCSVLFLQ